MGDLLEAARGQLVDVRADPGHADPLGDHQQRDGQPPTASTAAGRPGPPGRTGRGPVRRSRCSGDPSAPTPASRQPRRAASVAMASVSGVLPEQDTAMTASAAPTQPGSRSAWRDDHLDRAAEPGHGVEHLARQARAAHARHHDGARPAVRGEGRQVGLRARPQRGAHLGRRRGHLPQHVAGIGRLDHVGRVEPVRGQDELGPAPAVQVVAHACAPRAPASSTSSTGMSSRTG